MSVHIVKLVGVRISPSPADTVLLDFESNYSTDRKTFTITYEELPQFKQRYKVQEYQQEKKIYGLDEDIYAPVPYMLIGQIGVERVYGYIVRKDEYGAEAEMVSKVQFLKLCALHCVENAPKYIPTGTLKIKNTAVNTIPKYRVINGKMQSVDGNVVILCVVKSPAKEIMGVDVFVKGAVNTWTLDQLRHYIDGKNGHIFNAYLTDNGVKAKAGKLAERIFRPTRTGPVQAKRIAKKGDIDVREIVHVCIPENTKEIEDRAFFGCTFLETVEIPIGVKRIGVYAFSECPHLKRVVIPSTVEIIDNNAFNYSGLEIVVLDNGQLKRIGFNAFGSCALKRLVCPESLEVIGSHAFSDCAGLKSVRLNEGLRFIGIKAFSQCTSLTAIQIPTTVRKVEQEVFDGATHLERVEIPSGECPVELRLEDNVFKETALRHLTINRVRRIPTIGEYNVYLKKIVLSEGTEEIQKGAFAKMDNLKEVRIPRSVQKIGENLFSEEALKKGVKVYVYAKTPASQHKWQTGVQVERI